MSKNAGVLFLFGGLISLAVWRVFVSLHLRGGINVFSFLLGISLCTFGVLIVRGHKKS